MTYILYLTNLTYTKLNYTNLCTQTGTEAQPKRNQECNS